MSPVRYYLSSNQKNELLVRGRALTIAIPLPPEHLEEDQVIDFAMTVLGTPDILPACHFHDGRTEEVRVRPTNDVFIGRIVPNEEADDHWTIGISCAVVQIDPPGDGRHEAVPMEFPAGGTFRGVSLWQMG